MRPLIRSFLFLASAVCLAASSAAQTANILYNFTDFQHQLQNVSQVAIVPMLTSGSANGALLSQYFRPYTRTTTPSLASGTFTLTNVVPGVVYRTTFIARGGASTYDILVPSDTPDGATVGAWTNVVNIQNGIFLSYLPRVPGAQPGFIPVAVNAYGDYIWTNAPTGSGGAATNVYQSQRANSLITIATNLSTLVYTFSGVDQTNAIGLASGLSAFAPTNQFDASGAGVTSATAATNGISLASGLAAFRSTNTFDVAGSATAATNGYPWGTLYDSAGAALAATNGLGVASQLSAFAPTNQFDRSGSATAATNGYPWGALYQPIGALTNFDIRAWSNSSVAGVTITNLGDGANTNLIYSDKNGRIHPAHIGSGLTWTVGTETLSAPAGGAGTVTSVGLSGPSDITISGSPVTGAGTLTFSRTAGALADYNSQNLSNLNSIVVGAGSITNTSLTGNTMLKSDANKKTVSATAGTDYVAPATTITIAGTANQITSSVGAQDLSANRTVTLSIPSTFITPGTADHVGSVTNESNVSTTGNATNFAGTYLRGGTVATGGFTNSALTANTLVQADANKKLASVANGVGMLTNDASGNLGYTLIGSSLTSLTGTNIVLDTSTLAATSNGTNYTASLRSGLPGMQTIITDKTNVNLSLVGTNLADVTRSIFINNFTNLANCNITFTFTAVTNYNFSTVVSNGWGAILNIWNADTSGTNVLVSDAGRYHH